MGIDPFLIAQGAQVAAPQNANPENYPRFHQPFQQESIPGAIIGALLSASPATKALMQNINDYRNRDVGPAMQAEAARQFRTIGSPEANHVATVIEQNPQVAAGIFAEYGGPEQTFMAMSQNAMMAANTQRENNLVQNWLATTPPAQRTAEALRDFALDAKIPLERATKIAELYGKMAPKPYKPTTAVEKSEEAIRRAIERGAPKEEIAALQDELKKARYGTGMLIHTPEGLEIRTGVVGGEAKMTPTTKSRLQEREINSTNQLAMLREIGDAFDPRFHKFAPRIWAAGLELYEKAMKGEETLTGEDQALIEDLYKYRVAAYRNLNETLRAMSGVAVNPQEAARLLEQIVDVGKHWWQGDSPTAARRKYETAVMLISRDKARTVYRLRHPDALSAGSYSLDQMYKLIIDRGVEEMQRLEKQYPGISEDALRQRMNAAIVKEFGVNFDDVRDPKDVRRSQR